MWSKELQFSNDYLALVKDVKNHLLATFVIHSLKKMPETKHFHVRKDKFACNMCGKIHFFYLEDLQCCTIENQ